MKKRILFLLTILAIIAYSCFTKMEEGPISPTAPSVNYTARTNTPSNFGISLLGSYGNLKVVIGWIDSGNDIVSYNLYRNNELKYTLDKADNGPELLGLYYIYIDTVPIQDIYKYKIESVGVNDKKKVSTDYSIGCINYSKVGTLTGTNFTYITNYDYSTFPITIKSIQKLYISGVSILATSLSGKAGFCKSDPDGKYTIEGLPEGNYTVGFYHPSYNTISISVSISNNITKTTNIRF